MAVQDRVVRGRFPDPTTHTVDTRHAQFGLSRCVGCGRCIVRCPVGIDITEEVAAIAATDGARRQPTQEAEA